MNGENIGDPGNTSKHEDQAVEESAKKGHPCARTKDADEQQRDAKEGKNAGMAPAKRESQKCAADDREKESK